MQYNFYRLIKNSGNMMATWIVCSPHSKKFLGSIPGLGEETLCEVCVLFSPNDGWDRHLEWIKWYRQLMNDIKHKILYLVSRLMNFKNKFWWKENQANFKNSYQEKNVYPIGGCFA